MAVCRYQWQISFCVLNKNVIIIITIISSKFVITSLKALILGQAGVPGLIAQRARIKFSFGIKASFCTVFAARMFATVHLDCLRLIQGIAAKWTTLIRQFSMWRLLWRLGRRRNKILGNHLIPKTGNLHQWYWRIHNGASVDQFQSEIRCSVFY